MLIDSRNLPASLKVHMPEYLIFVERFRHNIVMMGNISSRTFEKREAKAATFMFSHFLYNVLIENGGIIQRLQALLDDIDDVTAEEKKKLRLEDQIEIHL